MNALRQFLTVALFVLAGCSSVAAAGEDWHWIRVSPKTTEQGWEVLQGTTKVDFTGSKFSTKLDYKEGIGGTHYSFQFALAGTIKDGKVTATEVRLNSDMSNISYRGTMEKEATFTNAKAGRIILQNGPWFIGLYRQPETTKTP